MRYFYFTLGPVQDFVSQARRTRDFWAGSFLLSWLSAVAMQSVKNQCTTAELLPEADTHFLDCLQGRGTGKNQHKAACLIVFGLRFVAGSRQIWWSKMLSAPGCIWQTSFMPRIWYISPMSLIKPATSGIGRLSISGT